MPVRQEHQRLIALSVPGPTARSGQELLDLIGREVLAGATFPFTAVGAGPRPSGNLMISPMTTSATFPFLVSVLPHVILLPDASQEMLLRSFSLLRILFSGKAPCSLPPKVAEGRCQDDSPITIALRRHSGSFLCCRRLAASQPRGATPA